MTRMVCKKRIVEIAKKKEEKFRGGKAKWKTHQQQQQQTLFTNHLTRSRVVLRLNIFTLSLSLSYAFVYTLSLSLRLNAIQKNFPFVFVSLLFPATSCHLTCMCGSELAILFPHFLFHVWLVGVLRKCFFVYCDCFTSLASNRDEKRQREQNGWTSQWNNEIFLPFFSSL